MSVGHDGTSPEEMYCIESSSGPDAMHTNVQLEPREPQLYQRSSGMV